MELLFFDREDDSRPARVITIDPAPTAPTIIGMSSCQVCSLARSTAIGFTDPSIPRMECDSIPPKSCSTRMVARRRSQDYSREAASKEGDNTATAMKSVVVDPLRYDWEGDTPL